MGNQISPESLRLGIIKTFTEQYPNNEKLIAYVGQLTFVAQHDHMMRKQVVAVFHKENDGSYTEVHRCDYEEWELTNTPNVWAKFFYDHWDELKAKILMLGG